MDKKKRINKKTVKINLLFTCIFLIIVGAFIVEKSFTKGKAKDVPVNIVAIAGNKGVIQNNNEEKLQKHIKDNNKRERPGEDKSLDTQIEKLTKNLSVGKEEKAYTYDAVAVSSILDYKAEKDGKKIAFLTFDDGPSTTVTPQILDTLKQYNINATFFLLGENIDSNEISKELVKREFNEGHAIGNHTYSHNRGNMLYPNKIINVPVFMEDVEKTDKSLKNVLGQDFNTRILRLPGGYMSRTYYRDPNLLQLNSSLKEKNMISIDWNVLIKDAEGKRNKSAAELVNILKEQVGTKEKIVILMHDTYGKIETANALPQIIEYLKGEGYEFRTIN